VSESEKLYTLKELQERLLYMRKGMFTVSKMQLRQSTHNDLIALKRLTGATNEQLVDGLLQVASDQRTLPMVAEAMFPGGRAPRLRNGFLDEMPEAYIRETS
jgi:hypothetical protein